MKRTRIKICGLTRVQDVQAACRLGADAVGLVCHPSSPRYVAPERLTELAGALAPFVAPVLLFVDAAPPVIEAALRAVPNAWLQFHGHESPDACARHGRPYLKALPMAADVDLLDSERRFASAAALLADTATAGFGGSGRTFDWSFLPPADRRSRPLILAGGLRAANVAEAILAVRPFAVDVSSGVESQPGIKNETLMRDFIEAVRGADALGAAGSSR